MAKTSVLVQDISDTARWVAVFRARESQRPDALFCDPFALPLAGRRGFEIADILSNESHNTSFIVRTYLFDQIIANEIAAGVDVVVNLGAGLDARPYRMTLPRTLPWIEVDLPEILAHKQRILAEIKPRCALERISLDLRDRHKRLEFFSEISRWGKRILIVSEGILVYFHPKEVATLASELAMASNFRRWILDVVSSPVLDTMTITAGHHLEQSAVRFQFGPAEGPAFFTRYGWDLVTAQSVMKTAIRLNRTPIDPKLENLFPDVLPNGQSPVPWVGVCLFSSQESTPPSPI